MSIQSRSEQILQDTIDGVLTSVKDKSRLEHLLVQLNELIIEGGGGGGSSDYAVDLSMTINSSTFVITAQLINKDGDPIGTPQTIDLPMESVVVGASYDSTNKAIILTLQNGNTTSVPIGDIIYGLQPLIDAQHKLDADLVDDTNSTNKFVSDSDKTTWNAKQDAINSSHKLSADLVDDTNSTNKFVTEADKTAWNGKQDALTFDDVPTSESTNPVTSGGVYTALEEKQDTISDLATIRSNATAGAGAATVVTGIASTGNNYIELKSGQRDYLDTTVPTGNIPTGSVGMGFDEGVWTYESGTKVSEGEPTANLFDKTAATASSYIDASTGETIASTTNYFATDYIPVTAGKTYQWTDTKRGNAGAWYKADKTYLSGINTSTSSSTTIQSLTAPATAAYVRLTGSAIIIDSSMLNEGDTALPYEPYGKQFSFYSNGSNITDYVIYGNDGGVGDKTANLFDVSTTTHERITWSTGAIQSDDEYTMSDYINVEVGKTYTCSTTAWFIGYDSNGTYLGTYNEGEWNKNGLKAATTFVNSATLNAAKIRLLKKAATMSSLMLNEGDTALPYEPYGYKIPVICGGQTNIIYLANPLGANDSTDYATAQVDIPTVDGANNLICDTTVQPSKISLTYTGWHSDLDDTTARIEALENAPAPSGGMTYDTLYEGTTISSYPYPLANAITGYKFIIIAVGYSGVYTTTIVPVAVWSTVTSGGNNYDITIDTAQLRINSNEVSPRSANNRIVYGVYGIK